ncbi:hypothetical protein [Rhizobium grahamii]|uniref:Uncharacterized protein n=1 Tax=Rhizobium grahamii CCGE 502 TaxID=990285 RepID=S3H7Z9_9HYPH|nr:hypothetical protein [Rhizobium grahamii]EPE94375.1 hypothetical protein RGCCGE502_31857 [Rhizobium grahamii CCGE 502]
MGAMTIECAIAVSPAEFAKKFRQELLESSAGEGLTDARFRSSVDDESHLFVDLQWKDLATARANLEQVKALLDQDSQILKESSFQTNVR